MFDRIRAHLVIAGTVIVLPNLSARVLVTLIEHAPAPVSAQDLARAAWQLEHVSEDTIAQRIALLRKALGDDPRDPSFIRTVRGHGYALIAQVGKADKGRRLGWATALSGGVVLATVVAAALFTPHDRTPPRELVALNEVDALLARAGAQIGLHQRGETERAIALLREAFARDRSNPRVHTALSFALSTRVTKFGGSAADIAEAEALARGVIDASPGDARAWHALGYALDAQGRIDEALASYQQAMAISPDDYAAASSAAYLLKIRGRLHEALVLESRTFGAVPGSLYRDLQIADALDLAGDFDRSHRFAHHALLLNPDHPVVIAGLALIALRHGELAQAEDLLIRAGPGERGRGELARLAGRIALARSELDAARQAFEAAGVDGELDALALDYLTGAERRPAAALVAALDAPGQTWPEFHLRAAEVFAAAGVREEAVARLHTAVDLGWRDECSVAHSAFLSTLARSGELDPVLARIRRETGAQAGLVRRDSALLSALDAALPADPDG